jgi:hypothetical protein
MKSVQPLPRAASAVRSPEWEQSIRAQTERLISSTDPRLPARRARLLRYLVERTLKDEGEGITEYAIALDVFDRPSSFDPKTDAVVRAETGRLRQNLADYYAEHKNELVTIRLPARTYIPDFQLREAGPQKTRSRQLGAGVLAAAVVSAVVAWLVFRPYTPPRAEFGLAVLPLSFTPAAAGAADGISPDLPQIYNGPLAQVIGLSFLDWGVTRAYRGPDALARARKSLPAGMTLQTVIDRAGSSLEANLVLTKNSDGSRIWSQRVTLPDSANPDQALIAAVWKGLRPVLEARYNRRLFELRNGLAKPQSAGGWLALVLSFLRPKVQFHIQQTTEGANSFDTRIGYMVSGQKVYSDSRVWVRQGAPVPIQPPHWVQFSRDTCVLVSEEGSLLFYEGGFIIPEPGANWLRFHYRCSPSAWPIDISRFANSEELWNEDHVPTGAQILANIPFLLPEGRLQDWKGDAAAGGSARPVTLVIPVNRPSIQRVYFLLNTEWCQPGPESYLSLEFTGDRGAHYVKPLIGGVDVRDYHHGIYVNTVNGTTSRLAYQLTREDAIDVVEVQLPAEFHQQTLVSVTLRDTGRHNFQRAILRALTVR